MKDMYANSFAVIDLFALLNNKFDGIKSIVNNDDFEILCLNKKYFSILHLCSIIDILKN